MVCRFNIYRLSFYVNMVGFEKIIRLNFSRFSWGFDVEMMDEDEEEFELWF